jgi:hypothetical protein
MPNKGMAKNPALHPPVPAAPTPKRPAWPSSIAWRTEAPGRDPAGLPRPAGQQAADTAATRPDLKTFVEMREKLHNALLKLELREQDVARLEHRNAYLERELKLQGQHHTNALKEVIVLKQESAKQSYEAWEA